jgi:hypothetical protein
VVRLGCVRFIQVRLRSGLYFVMCQRRNARPRFASVVPYDIPRLLLALFGILCPRRFEIVLSCGVPRLIFA